MSEFDDLVTNFKSSMKTAGTYVTGDDNTDIQTAAGPIPTLAKQAKLSRLRIDAVLPDLSKILVLEGGRAYDNNQQAWGRMHLGLDLVDNTPDAAKPMSTAVQKAIEELIGQVRQKENKSDRDVVNGYPTYEGNRLKIIGANNQPAGFLSHQNVAEREWTLPDKSGELALKSDLTGTNTGTNTGDETPASIRNKLNITVLTGINTGDFDSVTTYTTVAGLPNLGVDKRIYIVKSNATMYFWNGTAYQLLTTLITDSDSVPEGNNKYFTQLRSIESVLSTYAVSPSGVVLASDTVVKAIAKLQAQISTAINDYNAKLADRETLVNKATTFATVNHTLYPTVQAVKTYADALVAGVIKDCGNWDASTNVFPSTGGSGTAGAIRKGNFWYVNVAGTLGGVAVNNGDSFRALVDNPDQTASNWAVLESNLGYVPYNATNPAKYISAINGAMVTAALGYTPLKATDKDASNGVVGMTGFAVNLKNGDGTIVSKLINNGTAARQWTLPDKDGVLALMSDLSGLTSGTNTGDETKDTLLTKLGASQVTGSNTGDQTIALTGDVTGAGTAGVATTIAPNVVTLAKLQTMASGVLVGRSDGGTGNAQLLNAASVKALLGLTAVDNTSDATKIVSAPQQTALNAKENAVNKAVDFSVVDNTRFPTTLAVKNFLDVRLASVVVDCGNWDASSNAYPTLGGTGAAGAIKKGNLFYISGPGVIGGVMLTIGDSIRALVDNPGQTNTNWDALETNIGYVPYNATNPAGYISTINSAMVTNALGFTPENPAARNTANGYPTLVNYGLVLKNSAGAAASLLKTEATVTRNWVMPDKDGVVALLSDLSGLNSGTNTGDETQSTILSKLGATRVTGSNTGDETGTTIRAKLGGGALSGSNTGDETTETILAKLSMVPVNKAGDTLTGALNFAPGAQVVSAAALNLSSINSNVVEVTGVTQITSVALADGAMRFVRFAGRLTLAHGANLVLPTGASIITNPGDWAVLVGRSGGVVHCLNYLRASGMPVFGNSREKVRQILANTASTVIDLNTGDEATVFKVTIATNTTITFINPPPAPAGEIFNFSLITINDATDGRAMAFGNTIEWSYKQLPSRSTAPNAKDLWSFYIDNGVYGGSLSSQDQG
jgi:hypothetical protein